MNEFVIEDTLNIEESSKDIDYATGDTYDENNEEHVSEWAMAVALSQFKLGQTITFKELHDAVTLAQLQQTLDRMVEKGVLEVYWEDDDLKYRAI